MTLDQLNHHLELVVKLQAARETLEGLEASASGPGSQNLTGMPSAHNAGDKVGKLVTEIDALRRRVKKLERQVRESEEPIQEWIDEIEDVNTWRVFYHRFVLAKPWKEVADALGPYTSEATVKHICYRYLNFGPPWTDIE